MKTIRSEWELTKWKLKRTIENINEVELVFFFKDKPYGEMFSQTDQEKKRQGQSK